MHGARPDFRVIGLLQYAALPHPELGEFEDQILKSQPLLALFKFYFNSQVVSSNAVVVKRRSAFYSIHAKAAARNSPLLEPRAWW